MSGLKIAKIQARQGIRALFHHGLALASGNIPDVSKQEGRGEGEGLKAARILTDSRQAGAGDIFIAYRGVQADSHHFIGQVIRKKPALIVFEDWSKVPEDIYQVPFVEVRCGRQAWAFLCAEAWGNPQEKLQFYGVTGTNGKTSICWYVRQLLRLQGIASLSIGTLGIEFEGLGNRSAAPGRSSIHTTPDPPVFFQMLYEAVSQGIKHVIMECSSHSLWQNKTGPVRFEACAFSSFSRDHLDYHKTMEAYFKAKCRLFTDLLKPDGAAVISESVLGRFPLEELPPGVRVMAPNGHRQQHGSHIQLKKPKGGILQSKLEFSLDGEVIKGCLPVCGGFNVENFFLSGLLVREITGRFPGPESWVRIKPVPGRMEVLKESPEKGPFVCVDYAHTPDALEKALQSLKPLTPGRLWLVFGCGGERDQGKRPLMGRIAEALADDVIVTSDNPRGEQPGNIIGDIVAGFRKGRPAMIEEDREAAIAYAISSAGQGDVILIAGKGHESYQQLGSKKIPLDDRRIARRCLSVI